MADIGKGVPLAAALLALTACGSDSQTLEHPCTLIGAPPGVDLRLPAPYAARVASGSLSVCWGSTCRKAALHLFPSSTSAPAGCDGEGPNAVCGAAASPDGGKTAFAGVAGLPKAPVRILLALRNSRGRVILDRRVDDTPKAVFPNGPDCGEDGPRIRLTVADGRITTG